MNEIATLRHAIDTRKSAERLTNAQLQAMTVLTYSYGPELVSNGGFDNGVTGWTGRNGGVPSEASG
jgi:hypothetical protein